MQKNLNKIYLILFKDHMNPKKFSQQSLTDSTELAKVNRVPTLLISTSEPNKANAIGSYRSVILLSTGLKENANSQTAFGLHMMNRHIGIEKIHASLLKFLG
jgi:hypothetical protein